MCTNLQNEESGEFLFTCRECGAHNLMVIHEYVLLKPYTRTLPCTCEDSDQEFAVIKTGVVRSGRCTWGWLDIGHRWAWEEDEEVDVEDEEAGLEELCSTCARKDASGNWETEWEEPEREEESSEFYVLCGGCEREIEFGWSHPDRGGRIWPSECTDFNPWKCVPEPRYVEAWSKKGWLRPMPGYASRPANSEQ